MHLNFEFKAKTNQLAEAKEKLLQLNPVYKGQDHQTDTYYNINTGRLKLREGNIENALIYYERENKADAKASKVILYPHKPDASLKQILQTIHGIKVVVEKIREIYFIDNVKFHFDIVPGLGTFIEVEAIDAEGNIGIEKLKTQCAYYTEFFNIQPQDFIHLSYSDMLLQLNK